MLRLLKHVPPSLVGVNPSSSLYPLGEINDRSLLYECLLAPLTTGHHLIVHTWEWLCHSISPWHQVEFSKTNLSL